MRAALLAALAVLTGCTSTRTLPSDASFDPVTHAALAGRTVEIHLADGRVVPGQSIAIHPDSTSWIDPATGALVQVATADVRAASTRSRGRGAWQGALVSGLAASAVMSGVIARDLGDWGELNDAQPAFAVTMGTVWGFAPGAALGGAVGYAAGAERRYVLAPPQVGPVATPVAAAE